MDYSSFDWGFCQYQRFFDDGFHYSDFDIIYISNLCFNEELNEKVKMKIMKECKKGTEIFVSKPFRDLKSIEDFSVCQTWSEEGKMSYYKL